MNRRVEPGDVRHETQSPPDGRESTTPSFGPTTRHGFDTSTLWLGASDNASHNVDGVHGWSGGGFWESDPVVHSRSMDRYRLDYRCITVRHGVTWSIPGDLIVLIGLHSR